MRRIDESIESLAPGVAPGVAYGAGGSGATAPLAFRWRGRRYIVGTVLAHWVETGAWWRRTAPRPDSLADEVPDPERRLWRVEACRGAQTGVFDLCLEVDPAGPPSTERWSLHAIYD
jgi:hypothetical protein